MNLLFKTAIVLVLLGAAQTPALAQTPPLQMPLPQHADAAAPSLENPAAKLVCRDALSIYVLAAGGPEKAMPPVTQRPVNSSLDPAEQAAEKETKIGITRKRLADAIRKYGEKSNRTAAAYRVLARDYRDAAQYEKAVEALEAAARIYGGLGSSRKGELGDLQMELAQTYTNEGDRLSARSTYDAAEKAYTAAFGAKHPKVALALHNIGKIDLNMTQFEAALQAFRTAREIYEANLPAETSHLAELLIDTASLHARLGNRETALSVANEAVALSRDKLGDGHRTTALALHFAGTVNRGMGKSEAALEGPRCGIAHLCRI